MHYDDRGDCIYGNIWGKDSEQYLNNVTFQLINLYCIDDGGKASLL